MKQSDLVLIGAAFLLYSTVSKATNTPLLNINVPSPSNAITSAKDAAQSFISSLLGGDKTSLSPVSMNGITYALRETSPGNYSYYTYDPQRWIATGGVSFTAPKSTSIQDVQAWAGVPVQSVYGNSSGFYAIL